MCAAKSTYRHISLNALKIFNLVAELSSFKLAAEQLFLTPSAVSQQIKKLEANLGVPLFIRHSQGISLSEAGAQYWQNIHGALFNIEQSTEQLLTQYNPHTLRISLIPPIANRVIFPNLADFQTQYPHLKLIFDISEHNIDLTHSHYDLAIRFDNPPWSGCEYERLMAIRIQAICHQVVDKQFELSHKSENIGHAPLIHMTNRPDTWSTFLGGLKLPELSSEGINVNDYQNAMEAVLSYGVALALFPLERSYVQSHHLIAIPELHLPYGHIYAVAREGRLKDESIQTFLHWMKVLLSRLK